MMNWFRKLFGGSGSSKTSLPPARPAPPSESDWLQGETAETAYLFGSASEYFNGACYALKAKGAERRCSVTHAEAMVDEWQLESGRVVYVGYKTSHDVGDMLREFDKTLQGRRGHPRR